MRALTHLLAPVVAILTLAGAARADSAPPDDYVDPCAAMTFDEHCRRCGVPEFKSRDCHEGARAAGLVERCRGWSYAMYCRKDGTSQPSAKPGDEPVPPPEPPKASASPPVAGDPPPPLGQQPAPPSAPPPAVATGGACTIDSGRDATGLAFVLLLAVLRRRRAA